MQQKDKQFSFNIDQNKVNSAASTSINKVELKGIDLGGLSERLLLEREDSNDGRREEGKLDEEENKVGTDQQKNPYQKDEREAIADDEDAAEVTIKLGRIKLSSHLSKKGKNMLYITIAVVMIALINLLLDILLWIRALILS